MLELARTRVSLRTTLAAGLAGGLMLLCHPVAAQTATLPPTDISNQPPMPPPSAEPVPSEPVPAPETPLAPAEVAPVSPPAPAPVPAPVVEAVPPPLAAEPLSGFSDGTAFLRSPDNAFVLFPSGRLQVDSYVFHSANKVPNDSFLLRRARLEVGGWIGGFVYFWLAGDFASGPPPAAAPVAPANLATTDDYVALAPWKNLVILQVGQYDAPFTLENRTSDKYFDFMERSITVRAFGIPDNKEIGAMLHGFNDARNFYYSLAVVNGDGQNFKNADNHFDLMGRGWIAPFSFTGEGPLHDVEIGASFWTGDRSNTLALPSQTTQGGFTFLNMGSFTAATGGTTNTYQLRQVGRLNSVAAELNAPIAHRYGARGEFVWRHSPLAEEVIAANGTGALQPGVAGADLRGTSFYAEAFVWLLGDDRIIGDQQGIEPLSRFGKFGVKAVRDGVMVALRYEHLDETVSDPDTKGSPAVGKTVVDSGELGVNYWHTKRFRATFNYVVNHFDRGVDASPLLQKLASPWEQEFLFRLAIAL
ncbi:MAG TPA: porin [Polyangia bacterium]|nr:porin [Polyangia bacterium]